jgi:hypothetical protein
MELVAGQARLEKIVHPVLDEMREGPLKAALFAAFAAEERALTAIEECFFALVGRRQEAEPLRRFFHSWSKTNNSAASVSGLASRMTLAGRRSADAAVKQALYRVCDSLQRITDEDLGARGNVLHADLFYRMATTISGDDRWLSKRYCNSAADEFRDWADRHRLRERDLLKGLLITLIHEVYTHGEVEFILPLFQRWACDELGLSAEEARKVLAWISVHTGGTESAHFGHATEAVAHYCEAAGVSIDADAASALFETYLERKAAVMTQLTPMLQ